MSEIKKLKQGEIYQHFKGTKVEIICIARNCENPDENFVVYRHLERIREIPEGSIWIREINDFCGDKIFEKNCEYGGIKYKKGEKVKRFILIK